MVPPFEAMAMHVACRHGCVCHLLPWPCVSPTAMVVRVTCCHGHACHLPPWPCMSWPCVSWLCMSPAAGRVTASVGVATGAAGSWPRDGLWLVVPLHASVVGIGRGLGICQWVCARWGMWVHHMFPPPYLLLQKGSHVQ
jgi:hypothetical protein